GRTPNPPSGCSLATHHAPYCFPLFFLVLVPPFSPLAPRPSPLFRVGANGPVPPVFIDRGPPREGRRHRARGGRVRVGRSHPPRLGPPPRRFGCHDPRPARRPRPGRYAPAATAPPRLSRLETHPLYLLFSLSAQEMF